MESYLLSHSLRAFTFQYSLQPESYITLQVDSIWSIVFNPQTQMQNTYFLTKTLGQFDPKTG